MAKINGTSGADTLNGSSAADEINGLGDRDSINGGEGADVIDGGEGNDWLDGGEGTDTLRGGAGDDYLGDGSGGGSFEGGDGADTIQLMYHYQSTGSVLVDGGNDNDTIYLGLLGYPPAAATVRGGAGSDKITISFALNEIDITLGSQRDILSFNNSLFGTFGEENYELSTVKVTDFAAGNAGDVFDFAIFLGTSLVGWDQTANPFRAGYVRLVPAGTSTQLQIDVDGAASAYGFGTLLTLENTVKSAFTAANFVGYDPQGGAVPAGSTITGGDASEDFTGTLGKDVIDGRGANDDIRGGGGSDKLEGGDGNDYIQGELGHDLILGEAGDDSLHGGVGDDQLKGGDDNDAIFDDYGTNILDGGAGNDGLNGGRNSDTLLGGDGDDSFYDGGGSNRFDGGAGNDSFNVNVTDGGMEQTVLGGTGDDRFSVYTYNAESFLLDAGAGNDFLEINGDSGPLTVTLGSGRDVVTLYGSGYGSGGMTLLDFGVGPAGEKFDWGAYLSASLIGWNGTSNPFTAGFTRLSQSGTSTQLQIDLDGDDFSYGFVTIATFENTFRLDLMVENIGWDLLPVKDGTADPDRIAGTSAGDRLNGLEGNDVLLGYGGDDLIIGGAGNDNLNGGTGADSLHGGAGNDDFVVDNEGDRIVEASRQGVDLVRAFVSVTLADNVENLILYKGAVNGTGNELANMMTGNAAANALNGARGNDVIDGAGGNDRISGHNGNDTLKGGTGADHFLFHTALGSTNVDRILDFSAADDSLYLSREVFTKAGANGALAAGAFRVGTSAADADDRIVYDQAAGKIFYDSDGKDGGAAVLFATVTAGTALTNADFVVYG